MSEGFGELKEIFPDITAQLGEIIIFEETFETHPIRGFFNAACERLGLPIRARALLNCEADDVPATHIGTERGARQFFGNFLNSLTPAR